MVVLSICTIKSERENYIKPLELILCSEYFVVGRRISRGIWILMLELLARAYM